VVLVENHWHRSRENAWSVAKMCVQHRAGAGLVPANPPRAVKKATENDSATLDGRAPARANQRPMSHDAALAAYQRFHFDDGRRTRPRYRRATGRASSVIHEMPGLHPLVIRCADRLAAAGMTVVMPTLFGDPGREVTFGYVLPSMVKTLCIRSEFAAWAGD